MSDIEKRAEIVLCPFCGDWGAEVAESAVPSIHGGQKQAVYCNTCFCEGPTSETEKGAVEAWNRRAALTPPEGYVLVPVKPTEAMVDAVESIKMPHALLRTSVRLADFDQRYSSMLAARPEVSGG